MKKKTVKQKKVVSKIEIPKDTTLKIENGLIIVKGKKGELKRKLLHKKVDIVIKDSQIMITPKSFSKKEKKVIGTFKAHIKNMLEGVNNPFKYILKICSGHFPMNVSVNKNLFVIKNFLGEKVPRTLKLKEGATVKVEGDIVTVESADKEIAGQVASDIEQLTRRTGFDTRIFQDGIYIINKAKREIK